MTVYTIFIYCQVFQALMKLTNIILYVFSTKLDQIGGSLKKLDRIAWTDAIKLRGPLV